MNVALTVPRMYTDASGDSRFDTCEIPLILRDHAPPAAPIFTAEPTASTRYLFFRLPPRWFGEQHPTPYKCLVICLSGRFRFIGSAGDELIMRPGDRVLDLNTTGKGHATEVLSDATVDGLIVRLAEKD